MWQRYTAGWMTVARTGVGCDLAKIPLPRRVMQMRSRTSAPSSAGNKCIARLRERIRVEGRSCQVHAVRTHGSSARFLLGHDIGAQLLRENMNNVKKLKSIRKTATPLEVPLRVH